ncbi:hypothetical protein TUBRATIS_27480, partial [Tubulinosema ratisbonensis]
EFSNIRVYVNEIYSDFIKFFEPLGMQGNVTQSELDSAIENFHCESKLKIYNILFQDVRKENFVDCADPLKLPNNTTSYIPYNHTKARELFFDLKPAVYQTNADRIVKFFNFFGCLSLVVALFSILYVIYFRIQIRRR